MASTLFQPRIAREEYDAFAALVQGDEKLPATYGEWLECCTQEREKKLAHGWRVVAVDVNAQEFADFCSARGQDPNRLLLGILAAEKGRRQP